MGFCKFPIFLFTCLMITLTTVFSVAMDEHQSSQIMKERVALISFKEGIRSDPTNVLKDWNSNSNLHVCDWAGVVCNNASNHDDQVVKELVLSGKSLRGTISPSFSNLSSLVILDLSRNFFQGHIPMEIGSLVNLQQLSLSGNHLQGEIPHGLGFLHKLVYLDLGSNRLVGEIPNQFFCNGSLFLQYVDLSNNSLRGGIPLRNGCELKDLKFFLLWSNKLVGQVPLALSNSTKLKWLDLESNMLSGELPLEILQKMPFLQFLYLSDNDFVSHHNNSNLQPFFASLVNSSNLQELELAGNNLGGEFPSVIGDLSLNLVQIHFEENLIFGSIPPQISNLVNLTLLNLSSNLLNGTIPFELCKVGKLERVYLSNNSLFGEIPSCLGQISHLGLLDLSKNNLSGSIPDSFADLPQLRRLFLYGNKLSGKIPSSLGKCINLEILDLSQNKISGLIPSEVLAGLSSLKLYLNLSSNHLNGPIPLELSKMDMVLAIDLSSNNLSGSIPSQLGSCIALENLNVSSNSLNGPLPISIGQLSYLKSFDVSSNKLIGEIPKSFGASSTLKHLNFSFNNFSGNLSSYGAFSSLTIKSFLGNNGLCGSIKGMKKCQKKHSTHYILPTMLSLFGSLTFFVLGYILVRYKMRKQFAIFHRGGDHELGQDDEQENKELKYPRISYAQLTEATNGFTASNLIGTGQFGHVYKGILHDNTKIAVKVIDTRSTANEISKSFKRECQVLRRIRHRNLIKIITICSRSDFKALVLPLMPNGSLERHMYPRNGVNFGLDLVQLVNICSDVAEGIAYLHHHSPVRVVHCDLKPSNILLDDDLTALVTDFGIARLLDGGDERAYVDDQSNSFSSTQSLLCGSLGYIAPEYGLGKRASTQGDVFSFGVLLLEIVIGMRPTDVLFHQGSSLHEWVKTLYPYKLDNVIDQALQRYSRSFDHHNHQGTLKNDVDDHKKIWKDVILELIELGLICTQYTPSSRPTMVDVAHEMSRLKEHLSNSFSLLLIDHEADDHSKENVI